VFAGELERVRIACLHHVTAMEEGGLRFATLEVRDGQLTASYQARPFLVADATGATAGTSVLAANVATIAFQYADWDAEQGVVWLESWDPERQDLPLAILLQVSWQDGREESWLRRTAASGWRERFGKWVPQPVGASRGS